MLAAMYGRISCVKKLADVGANVFFYSSDCFRIKIQDLDLDLDLDLIFSFSFCRF